MQNEIETQVLDINKEEVARKLIEVGAKVTPEVLQKRWIFDIAPTDKMSEGEWIRLRQVGDNKPTVTYKKKGGKGRGETAELEVGVEDFDEMAEILSKLPFIGKYYQENYRHKFDYKDIEFMIDSWPKIPTYLEIEAKSEEKIDEGLELLGFNGKDEGHIGTNAIFKKYGLDLHSFTELKF